VRASCFATSLGQASLAAPVESDQVSVTKAVILAGGLGSRLFPVTKSLPKEMLPLGTRPTIQGVAEEIEGAGVTDVLIVTSATKRIIENHFDQGTGEPTEETLPPFPLQARYYYTRQSAPRGLGDAVLHGKRFVGEDHFIVALGDCLLVSPKASGPMRRMVELHLRHQAQASICVQTVSDEKTRRYGIVAPAQELAGGALELADIVEKPGPEAAPSRLAVAARYVLSPLVFSYLEGATPGYGKEIQLTDAIRGMIRDGQRVLAVPLGEGERRLDVGDFASYSRGFVRAMLAEPEYGEQFAEYLAALAEHLRGEGEDPDVA